MADQDASERHLADIQWDDEQQPVSARFGDIYYSKENGLEESRYVFLQGNELAARWKKLQPHQCFTIFETGFGTGLNFLATWQHWKAFAPQSARLHFISVEKFPLPLKVLRQALGHWEALQPLAQQLFNVYPPQPWQGFIRLDFTGQPAVSLTLILDDIEHALSELAPNLSATISSVNRFAFAEQAPHVDAWFLDGFAPSKNPEMWSNSLFNFMAHNSVSTTTFSTFTAASRVRQGLQAHGFHCKKIAGYGRKREMLCGTFAGDHVVSSASTAVAESAQQRANWAIQPAKEHGRTKDALVVGAGIAGALTAYCLAQRGYKVTVIERNVVAKAASGNCQGAVYTRLSLANNPLNTFNLAAQLFADQFYCQQGFYTRCGEACGVLHLITSEAAEKRVEKLLEHFESNNGFFQFVSREQSANNCGLALSHHGLLLPRSGWLNPNLLCRQLLECKGIDVHEQQQVLAIQATDEGWAVTCSESTRYASNVIICNAHEATHFSQLKGLNVNAIRGQVSHVLSSEHLNKLNKVICGEGYLPPATTLEGHQIHCAGASFNLKNQNTNLCQSDHEHNLQALENYCLDIHRADLTLHPKRPGKVGFRCSTPDYLPITGPVPDTEELLRRYAFLAKKANAKIDSTGTFHPGLYCNIGFGSRGLAYGPLCATLIADLIDGNYLPIGRQLFHHLHPARFAIRSLIKNKPLDRY